VLDSNRAEPTRTTFGKRVRKGKGTWQGKASLPSASCSPVNLTPHQFTGDEMAHFQSSCRSVRGR